MWIVLLSFLLLSTQAVMRFSMPSIRVRSIVRPIAISSLVFTNNWGSGHSIGGLYSPSAALASDLVALPGGIRESIAKGLIIETIIVG